mmetsp:Transcript_45425/g.112945  ORF Transcript_45425/g.112945 Transcript_45425/m.112945 type:complete len:334 (-) Transcript_45425:459-1460(-)
MVQAFVLPPGCLTTEQLNNVVTADPYNPADHEMHPVQLVLNLQEEQPAFKPCKPTMKRMPPLLVSAIKSKGALPLVWGFPKENNEEVLPPAWPLMYGCEEHVVFDLSHLSGSLRHHKQQRPQHGSFDGRKSKKHKQSLTHAIPAEPIEGAPSVVGPDARFTGIGMGSIEPYHQASFRPFCRTIGVGHGSMLSSVDQHQQHWPLPFSSAAHSLPSMHQHLAQSVMHSCGCGAATAGSHHNLGFNLGALGGLPHGSFVSLRPQSMPMSSVGLNGLPKPMRALDPRAHHLAQSGISLQMAAANAQQSMAHMQHVPMMAWHQAAFGMNSFNMHGAQL